ncbi:MAG: prolipoprotein diacylglyceryl transferase [Bacteroidales bacterium]|nr:prolipoprotein diacylglyceryl transferase [Candidatus Physcousia equi]
MNTLYINWNPGIEAFHIGSLSVRWYSLCWCIGLLAVYLLERWLYKQQKVDMKKFEPLFIYCFVGILVGARLGHCLFYEPNYYLTSWKGVVEMLLPIKMSGGAWHFVGYEGLASHGGTLGLMVALWLFMRKSGLKLGFVLDNIAIVTPICACFIRLGNLMNSEIIGRVTDVPWAFRFFRSPEALRTVETLQDGSVVPLPRHPGQLYEAICYALFFCIGWWFYRRSMNQPDAEQTTNRLRPAVGSYFYFGLCLTLIFCARFFIEFTKEVQGGVDNGSLPLDMGQLLSIPFVLLGIGCMVRVLRKKTTKQPK